MVIPAYGCLILSEPDVQISLETLFSSSSANPLSFISSGHANDEYAGSGRKGQLQC
jgi:hypothetical protein